MANKFLSEGLTGKSQLWRYIVTLALTLIVGSILISIIDILLMVLGLPLRLTSISQSDIYLTLISVLLSFGVYSLFLLVFIKVLHKRDAMSIVNIVETAKTAKTAKIYGVKCIGKVFNRLKRFRWNRFLKGVFIWGIASLIVNLIIYISDPSGFVFNTNINIPLLIFLLIVCLFVQVSFEELIFRGYLNQFVYSKIKKPLVVIIITSLIFGLVHIANASEPFLVAMYVLTTFLIGMILSVATLYDNGIEMAIGIHFINNVIAFALPGGTDVAISPDSLFMLNPNIYSSSIISLIGILVFIVLVFLYKKDKIMEVLEIK
ncbi:MAG: lysostaphin resistance A-like protein [Methanobacteriaceae archaeon]